jgi:hypothetical protein
MRLPLRLLYLIFFVLLLLETGEHLQINCHLLTTIQANVEMQTQKQLNRHHLSFNVLLSSKGLTFMSTFAFIRNAERMNRW